ncbi:MAG: hypothetical protein ACRCZF_04265, partial [Gemmataceae bacterium]
MRWWICGFLFTMGLACQPTPEPLDIRLVASKRLDPAGIQNLVQLSNRIYTGSCPQGTAGFQSLANLGIVTVISVDGEVPDVAAAQRLGLKYVHLPIGYEGVPSITAEAIASVIVRSRGPVYVHCHHGKHRGPAAAAAALRCLLPTFRPEQVQQYLQAALTDEHYSGLYRDAMAQRFVPPGERDRWNFFLPSSVMPPPLTTAMVDLDATWAGLQKSAFANWPRRYESALAARLLREQFRELQRFPGINSKPEEFRQWLAESEKLSESLEQQLRGFATDMELQNAMQKIQS